MVAGSSSTCVATPTALCLSNGRFRVEVQFQATPGSSAAGQAVPVTSDTGYFWFFQATNIELVVKVLDGCAINGNTWVFAGGLTNVDLDISVTDAVTNVVRHYTNAAGTAFVPVQDTAAFACSAGAAYDWPQFGFDAAHSGNNAVETTVSRGNVASLAQVFSVHLPEIADGAPILAAAVQTPSGAKDLLFVTTKAGRLMALDARTGATVWSTTRPSGPNYTTSSPALDPGRQFVYGYALDGFVHKYGITDGHEVTSGGWPELTTLKPDVEKGSPALSMATTGGQTYLYMPNGGYPGDQGDYQGHVTTIRVSDGAQQVFNANCSDRTIHFDENGGANDCPHVQSAVWARSGVVFDSRTGRIYAVTGNGDFDGNAGGHDWGDTVFAITPDGAGNGGNPLDSYTPLNYQDLDNSDLDLGSTAPALLPISDTRVVRALAVQSGKDAVLRLLDLANLSGQGGPGHVGGEIQTLSVPQGGQVLTQPAVWTNAADGSVWVFVANNVGFSALQVVVDGSGNPTLAARWHNGSPGSSPIVANGILFVAGSHRIAALDPTTGTTLWSDTGIGSIHWESPILANGILYVTDEDAMLTAYAPGGAAPARAPAPTRP
jgi:outer membrane protein assembly factor BamB